MEKLRINLTEAERVHNLSVAISFDVVDGEVVIAEEWNNPDERWGMEWEVSIPPRILQLAMPWLAAALAEIAPGAGPGAG